jgi:hypothetical protein
MNDEDIKILNDILRDPYSSKNLEFIEKIEEDNYGVNYTNKYYKIIPWEGFILKICEYVDSYGDVQKETPQIVKAKQEIKYTYENI